MTDHLHAIPTTSIGFAILADLVLGF